MGLIHLLKGAGGRNCPTPSGGDCISNRRRGTDRWRGGQEGMHNHRSLKTLYHNRGRSQEVGEQVALLPLGRWLGKGWRLYKAKEV